MTLPEARERLLDARRLLAKGTDPIETAKLDKIAKSLAAKNDFQTIATARAERDIATDLRGALVTPRTNHRAAITTPKEAGALLRAIETFDGCGLTRTALRLPPHVFVRPGELRWAEWREFDLEKRVWTIPAHKMKMRFPHAVPLSRQAIEIIGEIEHDAAYSSFLFPSLRALDRPLSDNRINAALRRLG